MVSGKNCLRSTRVKKKHITRLTDNHEQKTGLDDLSPISQKQINEHKFKQSRIFNGNAHNTINKTITPTQCCLTMLPHQHHISACTLQMMKTLTSKIFG